MVWGWEVQQLVHHGHLACGILQRYLGGDGHGRCVHGVLHQGHVGGRVTVRVRVWIRVRVGWCQPAAGLGAAASAAVVCLTSLQSPLVVWKDQDRPDHSTSTP